MKETTATTIQMWLVLSLYTKGRISSGKAACLLNISRVAFLDLLCARSIAYVDFTTDEMEDDFAAVRALEPGSRL